MTLTALPDAWRSMSVASSSVTGLSRFGQITFGVG